MAVIKLKKNDADYDKSKSYKSETVNYISKKHFKSLECDKKSIRGFFCWISVIHPDILTCGGALELKKIADIADEHGVAVAIHMAESPVACLAAVHTAAAIHNCLALEFHSVDVPWWADMVTGIPNPIFENGFIKVPEKPGLGFDDLNEEVLRQHINPEIPGYFEPTDEWNREFSNDRIWS